ncbi:MAG: disulfide bond formation protein B [bacterium]|nr:disulfide bond formation protein B [bacterium]
MILFVNNSFSFLTVVAQILVALAVISLFFKRKENRLTGFFQKYGLVLAFAAAFLATVGSLIYSEIIGYEPCKLCWFQRIFMYPQVVILGLALFASEKKELIKSAIILSIIGAFIAFSHYILQTTGISIFPCTAVGYSASCSQRFVMNFGYITIPMMALSAFLLIVLGAVMFKKKQNDNRPISM